MSELAAAAVGHDISRILIIDDAFDDLTAEGLDPLLLTRFIDRIEESEELITEREQSGLQLYSPEDVTAETLAALAAGAESSAGKLAGLFEEVVKVDLADRANVRSLAARLAAIDGVEVETMGAREVEEAGIPPREGVDYVFLDYFLGGPGDAAVSLSISAARAARAALRTIDGKPPMLVLMSSQPSVSEQREGFKKRADAVGATFFFFPKMHLDDRWKVESCLKMLHEAKPYAATVEHFVSSLAAEAKSAMDAVIASVRDLELSDYSFLQQARLLEDGHPLGEYLSWVLSHHITHELFERRLSDPLRRLDEMMIDNWMLSQRTPSQVVGQLYQSAVYERGLLPLGPHPRHMRVVDEPEPLPHIVLGDVFQRDNKDAVVILSAACDLASGPDAKRTPKITSVLMVPGRLVSQLAGQTKSKESCVRTDVFPVDGKALAVEWDLNDWFSVEFKDLKNWLEQARYDVTSRARLRPLFALSLQHAFHAHGARVGVPKSPPLFQPARAELWWNQESGRGGLPARKRLYTWSEGNPSVFLDSKNNKRCRLDVSIATLIRYQLDASSAALAQSLTDNPGGKSRARQETLVADARASLTNSDVWDQISRKPLELNTAIAGLPLKVFYGENPSAQRNWMGLELHIEPVVPDEPAQ